MYPRIIRLLFEHVHLNLKLCLTKTRDVKGLLPDDTHDAHARIQSIYIIQNWRVVGDGNRNILEKSRNGLETCKVC